MSSRRQQAEFVQQNKTTSTTPMEMYRVVCAYVGGNNFADNNWMNESTKRNRFNLSNMVSSLMSEGWKPQGGVSIYVNNNNREVFAQAMVKEEG